MHSLEPLADIGAYHSDAATALRAFYSESSGGYDLRFIAYNESEVNEELRHRLGETELRSTLIVLARVEAAFRRDFKARVDAKKPDAVSIAFRKLYVVRGNNVRLVEDILGVWKGNIDPADRINISKFIGMLRTRHWLAHGRHWVYAVTHTYTDVYLMAAALLAQLPLIEN